MKRLIPLFLIFIFCSNDVAAPETGIQNLNKEFEPATTTTTIFDKYLSWDNFLIAWEKTLKEGPILSSEEIADTEELLELWEWDGDKSNTQNQYLYEITVNGFLCTRIYNSMGWALLDEVHPVEKNYDVHHTYKCDDTGDMYLFGSPFNYENSWWIYQNVKFDWETLDCDNPCATRAQNYASRFKIDLPLDLLTN